MLKYRFMPGPAHLRPKRPVTSNEPTEIQLPKTSFDVPVQRSLVHRRFTKGVLLTDGFQESEQSFIVSARWPRSHGFLRNDDTIDSALVAETLRQATIYVGHRFFGVPADSHFVMAGIRFEIDSESLAAGSNPIDLALHVTARDIRRGSEGLTSMKTSVVFMQDAVEIATGEGDLKILSPKLYARTRKGYGGMRAGGVHPWPHQRAGGDVVLPLKEDQWELIVDLTNPVYFDHPLDHVPGMLIIEAVRQVARNLAGEARGDLTNFSAQFSHYLELQPKTILVVRNFAEEDNGRIVLDAQVSQGPIAAITATATYKKSQIA